MLRSCTWILLAVLLGLSPLCATAATTVVVNGKEVVIEVVEKNGKAYIDVAALMKLLGGKATFDAANHKLYVNAAPAATTSTAVSPAAMGTAQLPGDNGKVDTVYCLGKDTNAVFFALKSIEYGVAPVQMGDEVFTTKRDEKLLIVHFTLQNPHKTDLPVGWFTLKYTAFDGDNRNYEFTSVADEATGLKLDLRLKPAQKIEAYTVFTVPAAGEIPKLMVQSPDEGAPVLRYNLHGLAAKLPAPLGDPADPDGATALTEVTAKQAVYYPHRLFQARVDSVSFVDKPLHPEDEAAEDTRYQVYTLSVKNATKDEQPLAWYTFKCELESTDGEPLAWNDYLILGTVNRAADLKLKPGQEAKVRVYFAVPKDATPAKFSLWEEEDGRIYRYELKP